MHQKITSGASKWANRTIFGAFYALKPFVLAHRIAPKMVCKFQLAHLRAPEAIFGELMTEICDARDFEGKMLQPRKV